MPVVAGRFEGGDECLLTTDAFCWGRGLRTNTSFRHAFEQSAGIHIRAAKTMSRTCRMIWPVRCAPLNVRLCTNPCGRLAGPARPGALLVGYLCVTLT
jgi:hypothetical protein